MIYPTNRAEIYKVAIRLIEEQFLLFEFCLEMLSRSSKMAYKMIYGKTLICQDYKLLLFALISLVYHAINLKTPLILILPDNIMLEKS